MLRGYQMTTNVLSCYCSRSLRCFNHLKFLVFSFLNSRLIGLWEQENPHRHCTETRKRTKDKLEPVTTRMNGLWWLCHANLFWHALFYQGMITLNHLGFWRQLPSCCDETFMSPSTGQEGTLNNLTVKMLLIMSSKH